MKAAPHFFKFIIFLTLFSLWSRDAMLARAYVASSSSYRIDSDAISIGGLLSTSSNYSLQSSISGLGEEGGYGIQVGMTGSASYNIKSGFLEMANSYIAISAPSNVSMSPSINVAGGGVGNGSAGWTVTTDSSGGYSLAIKASTGPALKSATDSFANYRTQISGIPDFNWSVGAGGDFFGFTPEGSDVRSLYKDDGSSLCNTGSSDTGDKCWDSISTSNKIISGRASPNHPTGTATTVKFRAEAGNLVRKAAGSYSATITVTVLAL